MPVDGVWRRDAVVFDTSDTAVTAEQIVHHPTATLAPTINPGPTLHYNSDGPVFQVNGGFKAHSVLAVQRPVTNEVYKRSMIFGHGPVNEQPRTFDTPSTIIHASSHVATTTLHASHLRMHTSTPTPPTLTEKPGPRSVHVESLRKATNGRRDLFRDSNLNSHGEVFDPKNTHVSKAVRAMPMLVPPGDHNPTNDDNITPGPAGPLDDVFSGPQPAKTTIMAPPPVSTWAPVHVPEPYEPTSREGPSENSPMSKPSSNVLPRAPVNSGMIGTEGSYSGHVFVHDRVDNLWRRDAKSVTAPKSENEQLLEQSHLAAHRTQHDAKTSETMVLADGVYRRSEAQASPAPDHRVIHELVPSNQPSSGNVAQVLHTDGSVYNGDVPKHDHDLAGILQKQASDVVKEKKAVKSRSEDWRETHERPVPPYTGYVGMHPTNTVYQVDFDEKEAADIKTKDRKKDRKDHHDEQEVGKDKRNWPSLIGDHAPPSPPTSSSETERHGLEGAGEERQYMDGGKPSVGA
jgi:hypothetical protein